MNLMEETALLLSSLSVYRGVLQRTVPKAFYRLLCCYREDDQTFFSAWGQFASLLYERGYSKNLTGCLTEAALFDENIFTRCASAGKEVPLPVQEAAWRDVEVLKQAGALTPEALLQNRFGPESPENHLRLPGWSAGGAVPQANSLRTLMDYHRQNGCGMFARYHTFLWREHHIEPVLHPDPVRLSSFCGYEPQRERVVKNTVDFLSGNGGNNCLLYGDMGTGKSSTVKAIANCYAPQGLRIVELPKDRLEDFPLLVEQIAPIPLRFIVFIDDLSFAQDDPRFAQLKAVLEGGIAARPDNTLIYATSNRRHLIRETFSQRDGDELHRSDTIQESLSLYDRFGLTVNYSRPGKEEYLAIVTALAAEWGLAMAQGELEGRAERWAIEKGGRSPRAARQLIAALLGKQEPDQKE